MLGGELAEVSGSAIGSGGAPVGSREGWGVVRQVTYRDLSQIHVVHHDVQLGYPSRLFQVAVVDVPFRVVGGHQTVADPLGESLSPCYGSVLLGEVHAAST